MLASHAFTIEFIAVFKFAFLFQNGRLDEQKNILVIRIALEVKPLDIIREYCFIWMIKVLHYTAIIIDTKDIMIQR